MSEGGETTRIRDETVPAVGHAAQGRTALKRRKKGSPYFFRGAVRIAPSSNAAVSEALDALGFVSTAQKTQLCIFADGSFDQPTHNGGYALAYNGFALGPDTSSNNRHVAKGWTAIHTADNHTCERLAIAQSVREAKKELTLLEERLVARNVDTAGAGDPVEVSVKIFSDSQTVLKAIKTGKFPSKMKHTGHAIVRFSEELKEKFRGPRSKLKVNLVVHWIPGHHAWFTLHEVADKLSRKCCQDKQPFLFNGADGVYEEVKATKRYREDRLMQWQRREQLEWEEAQAGDELQPQQDDLNTQQPGTHQPYEQEWHNQVQAYYQKSAAYWEQLNRWQDWQRAHGHQAGQWYWDGNANQWVWQWDNQRPGETGNGQPPS